MSNSPLAVFVAYDKRNRTPRMRHIDYGLGVFERRAFEGLAPGSVYDLATTYQDLLAADELAACEVEERFYEIGSAAGIEELAQVLNRWAINPLSADPRKGGWGR